jgi:hypothetical protein
MDKNRTAWYLGKIVDKYPKSFAMYYTSVKFQIMGIYFEDELWRKHSENKNPMFFLLVDPKRVNRIFLNFLKSTKKSSWYVDDYVLEMDNKHVFCFKVDPYWYKAFEFFKTSQYSKMYTPIQLKELGIKEVQNGKKNLLYAVLAKTSEGIRFLKSSIRIRFQTEHCPENPEEYDLPYYPHEEILNYKIEEKINEIRTGKK